MHLRVNKLLLVGSCLQAFLVFSIEVRQPALICVLVYLWVISILLITDLVDSLQMVGLSLLSILLRHYKILLEVWNRLG